MRYPYLIIVVLISTTSLYAQPDSTEIKQLEFTGDFRFRIEEDWDSRKSDGSFRTDRTRLRYRARFGMNYLLDETNSFGIRLRTGNPAKQQDPQMTLGTGSEEFGNVPISFEKLFYKAENNGYTLWLGKNTFPFRKMNELFWSDNVYPEGVFLDKEFELTKGYFENVSLRAGHFISNASGASLDKDSYFQGLQLLFSSRDRRLDIFPSLYLFKNIADIPDGGGTYTIDYTIFHTGLSVQVMKEPRIVVELDGYHNMSDLASNDSIPDAFVDEVNGLVSALVFGQLKKKGDWKFKVAYTYLERYSIVDIFAQNDWVRWDYSSAGSADGRLSNYRGLEIMVGYAINDKLVVNSRFFTVEQLIAYGPFKENGNRIRLDLDIKF